MMLICLATNYHIKFRSLNVILLFYASVGVRSMLGDGSPSEITLYSYTVMVPNLVFLHVCSVPKSSKIIQLAKQLDY